MHITPFGVEMWMNAWETKCEYNLAETCVHSLTIAELLALAGQNDSDLRALLDMRMTYGAIEGSDRLRAAISALYTNRAPEEIIVTHGTIGANMLVFKTLISAGDHVVSILPTYQQHYSIPESIGAQVDRLYLQPENNWLPDLDALDAMMTPATKMIALTNPNNPTGALIEGDMLNDLVALARKYDAWILADEVYRGTAEGTQPPSIADLYDKGIGTCGMSKAFSLAGLRLGWVTAPTEIIEKISHHRDYDTISVGMIDDHFATLALENADKVLARSRQITEGNREILAQWMETQPSLSWIRPKAGTTALLQLPEGTASEEFCLSLLRDTGVLLTPGSALDMEGYVRIGYANAPDILKDGLAQMATYLKSA